MLAVAGRAYGTGNMLYAAVVTFVINFFLGSLAMITIPSLIIPGCGGLLAIFRATSLGSLARPVGNDARLHDAAAHRDAAAGGGRLHPGGLLRAPGPGLPVRFQASRSAQACPRSTSGRSAERLDSRPGPTFGSGSAARWCSTSRGICWWPWSWPWPPATRPSRSS